MKEMFQLTDKVVIITGSAGLLGRKHAEVVAALGGIPICLDLNADRVKDQASSLKAQYEVPASGWQVDITREEEVAASCAEIMLTYGRIDGLVNNAANNPKIEQRAEKDFSRLENFSAEIWNMDIAVGLTGAFLAAKHYGHAIANGGKGGSILNISSDLGLIAPDQRLYRKVGTPPERQPVKPVTYSVVKSGIIGLTRYLATYWADQGVRANAICPGGVEANQDPEFIAELVKRIPLGRMARSDEYQGLVAFLLSDASSYINGSIIAADGGRSVW